MTVRGPVPADELGITLAHEHLFFRLDCYYSQAEDDPDGTLATAPITPGPPVVATLAPLQQPGQPGARGPGDRRLGGGAVQGRRRDHHH